MRDIGIDMMLHNPESLIAEVKTWKLPQVPIIETK